MSEHNRFGIAPEVWAKFDPALRQTITSLQADPTLELPVMIVLVGTAEPPGVPGGPLDREARAQQAQERKAAFEHEIADLVQELKQAGARDLQLHWINRTVSARLTLPALEAGGRREEVRQIVLAVRQKVIASPTGREGD